MGSTGSTLGDASGKRAFKKSSRPWVVLVCCCIMQAIGFFVPSMMVSIFITPLIKAGFSATAAPLLSYYTVQLLCSIVVLLLAGNVLKKVGAAACVVGGAVVCGLGWILFALFPSMPMYYVTAAMNSLYPLCSLYIIPVLINNWFYKNKGLWTSLALAFSGVGSFVLSPVITDIIATSGWHVAALSMGVVLIVVLGLIGIFVIRLSPIPLGILPQGATQEDVEKILEQSSETGKEKLKLPGVSWRKAVRQPAFYVIAVSMLLIGFLSAFNTNVNTLAQSAGYSAAVAGFTMSAAAVGQIIGKPIAGAIKDKWGAGAGTAFGFGLTAVGLCIYIAAIFASNEIVLYVAGFVTGTGITSTLNMPALITDDAFGLKDYETLYSIDSSLRALGLAIFNPIVGTLLDMTGTYLSGLIIWIIAAVTVIPVAFIGIRMGQKLWKGDAK